MELIDRVETIVKRNYHENDGVTNIMYIPKGVAGNYDDEPFDVLWVGVTNDNGNVVVFISNEDDTRQELLSFDGLKEDVQWEIYYAIEPNANVIRTLFLREGKDVPTDMVLRLPVTMADARINGGEACLSCGFGNSTNGIEIDLCYPNIKDVCETWDYPLFMFESDGLANIYRLMEKKKKTYGVDIDLEFSVILHASTRIEDATDAEDGRTKAIAKVKEEFAKFLAEKGESLSEHGISFDDLTWLSIEAESLDEGEDWDEYAKES